MLHAACCMLACGHIAQMEFRNYFISRQRNWPKPFAGNVAGIHGKQFYSALRVNTVTLVALARHDPLALNPENHGGSAASPVLADLPPSANGQVATEIANQEYQVCRRL